VRYRLTLEAEVDGQPKRGASVIEVTYAKQLNIRSELSIGYRGEAVVLDLGPRGTLFALLKEGSDTRSIPQTIIFRAFNFDGGIWPSGSVEHLQGQLRKLSGTRELALTSLPLLVRFRDLNDPTTVEAVDPLNISEKFGPGTRLNRATLEMVPVGIWPLNLIGVTGTSITNSIKARLPWLAGLKSNLDGTDFTSSRRLSNELHVGNFRTWY
jgi:hypothetical protein